MKIIKGLHKSEYAPIDDLETYRAMPTHSIPMNRLDPFIFLNHHGPQQYSANNNGLPFGPHPHRGFETVTFIVEGDLIHKDNAGGASTIHAGGIQWMRAGSGLVHNEVSSEEFKQNGGALEILQLWVNLPAKYKMEAPKYTGLQKNDIPTIQLDHDGLVNGSIISGEWLQSKGPIEPLTDIHLATLNFKAEGRYSISIPADKNVFLYVVKGRMRINGEAAETHHLVEFSYEGLMIEMKALEDSFIIFGYATPYKEPFVAYGPFVMNTQEEIMQAYEDYHGGKFGNEKAFADA